jgi:glycosyltransferase involved in cell wall biosynthesis
MSKTIADTDLEGGLVLACEFAARHAGGFLPSQFAVARAARERLGLRTVFVFPERALRRSTWVPQVAEAGFACEFLPASAHRRPRQLRRIASAAHARIVHSHFAWFDLDSLYAGRRTGAAVVWHVHNSMLGYPVKQRLSDLVKVRLLAHGCDAVIAVSEQVGRDLLRRGFPAAKTTVILNGLVLDPFERPRARRSEIRDSLGIDADALVVLSFCWPPLRKGVDVLVEAMTRIQDTELDRPLAVVLVGEQPATVERFLRQRVSALPSRLSIIPPMDDVAALLGAGDVFVSAAREEGMSLAIGEAMAAGLPVLGSDIPGTAHYWPAPSFLRYPVEDPGALAQELRRLATSHAREGLGAENRRWAFEHLGIDRYVDETIDCYRCLLAARPA